MLAFENSSNKYSESKGELLAMGTRQIGRHDGRGMAAQRLVKQEHNLEIPIATYTIREPSNKASTTTPEVETEFWRGKQEGGVPRWWMYQVYLYLMADIGNYVIGCSDRTHRQSGSPARSYPVRPPPEVVTLRPVYAP
ncbi:hypothetical protein CISG_06672 [Coccidioides immitis RMSCC 3703]|uniref:Uncharacterized protein n=2 Tax=Coccidioides immitis TaxID=5501 RepID=A0A0J8QZD8_COCIT|nr:hypothetical protein CIRG_02671 [Coccidioides immitis RMSCC 2394]KMU77425.1 hypothetical protein CISG_06672 [Coccidioides immitis RMSCC 3703]